MLFRVANLRENVLWFPIAWETISHYLHGVDCLIAQGWIIQAIVCDGRQGVKKALSPYYPIQMCHFHQVKIVTKYLTQKPELVAGQELRALILTLARTDEQTFTKQLKEWHQEYGDFIKQRTVNPETKHWHYTHGRVRSAYQSIKNNLPYLFTYQNYPHIHIPNTINSLDGSISHLRNKLRAHRGLKLTQRIKITGELLKGENHRNLY